MKISHLYPSAAPYESFLESFRDEFRITSPLQWAMFVAQIAHESGEFRLVKENLNYSAEALMKTWPKRFDTVTAANYARRPDKIANKVYSNRMGNGDEASGEGARFIGRGLKQLTGKDNYRAYSIDVYGDDRMLETPQLLEQPLDAARSAAWFWYTNKLGPLAEKRDIEGCTKKINDGLIGIEGRKAHYKKVCEAMGI